MRRLQLAELMDALYRDDEGAIVAAHKVLGYESERNDPYVSRMMATLGFDRDDRETCQGMNIQVRTFCLNQSN